MAGYILLAIEGKAAAQPSGSDADVALRVTIARATLAEGKQRMAEGRWRDAMEKLDVSVRYDPGPEALLDLGICQEELGATASAWGAYRRTEERARALDDAERAAEAAKRGAAVEPRLVRVIIVVEASEPHLHVSLDGRYELGENAWGTALPVDPGRHTVDASAPGRRGFSTQIDLFGDGVTQTVVVPALSRIPPLPPSEASDPFAPSKGSDEAGKRRLWAGLFCAFLYSAGVIMLVDEDASTATREAGAVMGGATLGAAGIWAGAELSSAYRMTPQQGLGAAMMGTGIVSLYTSLLAVCAVGCIGDGPAFSPSRDEWIAIAAFGLAVGPALIAGGYFVMGKDPVKSRRDSTAFTIAPLVGGSRAGLSLKGSF